MPLDALSFATSACMSAAITPDLFTAVSLTNAVMAAATPDVPALALHHGAAAHHPAAHATQRAHRNRRGAHHPVHDPIGRIIHQAVMIPDEAVMPMAFAYSEMAAMLIP